MAKNPLENAPSVRFAFREKLASVHRYLSAHPALSILVYGLILALVISGSWFAFTYAKYRFSVPQALSANFNLEYRKLPFDTRSVDISFSVPLDPASIQWQAVSFSPFVEGKAELKDNGKTISYVLDGKLKAGEQYLLTISPDVSSVYGVKFGEERRYLIEAIGSAMVTKILPEGKIDDLSKEVAVLFNIPMVNLTNLDSRDKFPCPIEIEPKTEGDCRWISTNAVSFRPKTTWGLSTRYTVRVKPSEALNYPLKNGKESVFETTDFQLTVQKDFRIADGISVISNAQITAQELSKAILLPGPLGRWRSDSFSFYGVFPRTEGDSFVPEDQRYEYTASGQTGAIDLLRKSAIPFEAKQVKGMEWYGFSLYGSGMKYGTSYVLVFPNNIVPTGANRPLPQISLYDIGSKNFLESAMAYRKVLSDTGALIDTIPYDFNVDVPSKNVFFQLSLGEEVSLDPKLIEIRTKSGTFVPCQISYVKEDQYDDKGVAKSVENKSRVQCQPDKSLEADTSYELRISHGSFTETKQFKTAPKMALGGIEYVSPTEICLYVSNQLESTSGYSSQYDKIQFEPKAVIRDLTEDRDRYDWSSGSQKTLPKVCKPKSGFVAYIIGSRLNPNTHYSFSIDSTLEDYYGQKLAVKKSYSVDSKDIKASDRYLYVGVDRDRNTLPDTVPFVVGLLSVNLEKAQFQVCEMDQIQYLEYLSKRYDRQFSPNCSTKTDATITLKNLNWTLSHTAVDIEKDVLARPVSKPFVLVRGTVDNYRRDNGSIDSEREFETVYIRAGFSAALEVAANYSTVFATTLSGTESVQGVSFKSYTTNVSNRYVESNVPASFDAQKGVYVLKVPDNSRLLLATDPSGKVAPIDLGNDQAPNYDFKYVSGVDSSARYFSYVYSDRPIYRPGDVVEMKLLVRKFAFDGYRQSPEKQFVLSINSDEGTSIASFTGTLDQYSHGVATFRIPKDVKYGRYTYFVSLGKSEVAYTSGDFSIEAYKKPVFKVTNETIPVDSTFESKVRIPFTAQYYYGGILPNADYTYAVRSQNYFFDPKEYAQYQFGEGYGYFECLYWGSCNEHDETLLVGTGRLDGTGKSAIDYQYPAVDTTTEGLSTREKIFTFVTEVQDPQTGKSVSQEASQIVRLTDGYVGLQTNYFHPKAEWISFDAIALTPAARPIEGANVEFVLTEHRWNDAKKLGVDGVYYHEPTLEKIEEAKLSFESDDKGEIHGKFQPKNSGTYVLRATYTGKNGKSFVTESTLYVDDGTYVSPRASNNSIIELTAEKNLVNIGETAKLSFRAPSESGMIVIHVEKDDGILAVMSRKTGQGIETIELPIKKEHLPNIYVKAFWIGSEPNNPLPMYRRALAALKVSVANQQLTVSVATDKQRYVPGDSPVVEVTVKDAQGNPVPKADVSLSVVDESVLALAGNPKKNPFAFFYDLKRYLGVETYISLVSLVEKLEVKNIDQGEKGGAGENQKGGDSKKKRGVFKDTAFWKASLVTDASGRAKVLVSKLPDNLTTWNIEAVAATADTRVGVGTASAMSNLQVMIHDNTPRFLGSKDVFTLAPTISNRTGKDADIMLKLTGTGFTAAKQTVRVRVPNGEDRPFPFEITVQQIPAIALYSEASFTFEASSDSGLKDALEIRLPIYANVSREVVTTAGKTSDVSVEEKIDLSKIKDTAGTLTVSFAPTLVPNLLSGIDFLQNYPYGCAEQQTSAIMPNVYIKHLYQAWKQPFDLNTKMVKVYVDKNEGYVLRSVDEILREYLVNVFAFQKPDGGIGYWKDFDSESDLRLSAYVAESLGDIRAIGYSFDNAALTNLKNYLVREVSRNERPNCRKETDWNKCKYPEYLLLEGISAVAKISTGDDAFRLIQARPRYEKDRSSELERLRSYARIGAYSQLKDAEKALVAEESKKLYTNLLSNHAIIQPKTAFFGKTDAGSRSLSTARFIEASVLLGGSAISQGDREILDRMERFLISEKRPDGSFGSTYETSSVIASLARYYQTNNAGKDVDLRVKAIVGDLSSEAKVFTNKNVFESAQKSFQVSELPDAFGIRMEKSGNGNVYYDIAIDAPMPAETLARRDEGFGLDFTPYSYDEYSAVKRKKDEEWKAYMLGTIRFSDLKYPKNVIEYLTPATKYVVGKLYYFSYDLVASEARSNVFFEGFLPSGAELVNTNLKTENSTVSRTISEDSKVFNREEFRDDRFFASADYLDAGIYHFGYAVRMTHAGTFAVMPARISEFYRPEIFGRTAGRKIDILPMK